MLGRFFGTTIGSPVSVGLGLRSRLIIRAIAYSCPVLAPLLASMGLFELYGWVALLGLASLWAVFLLCGPPKLEQAAFAILSWYYVVLLVMPALSMD